MKQKALRTVATLISGAANVRAGAAVHGASLGLVVGSKALMDADLEPLKLAVNAHLSAFGELRKRRTASAPEKAMSWCGESPHPCGEES